MPQNSNVQGQADEGLKQTRLMGGVLAHGREGWD